MEEAEEKPDGERLLEQHGDTSFTIGEVAEMLGVREHTIRFWEKTFKLVILRNTETNRRRYSRADISLLKKIQRLAYKDGMSLKNARHQLVAEGVLPVAAGPVAGEEPAPVAPVPRPPAAVPELAVADARRNPAAPVPALAGQEQRVVTELQAIARLLRET